MPHVLAENTVGLSLPFLVNEFTLQSCIHKPCNVSTGYHQQTAFAATVPVTVCNPWSRTLLLAGYTEELSGGSVSQRQTMW